MGPSTLLWSSTGLRDGKDRNPHVSQWRIREGGWGDDFVLLFECSCRPLLLSNHLSVVVAEGNLNDPSVADNKHTHPNKFAMVCSGGRFDRLHDKYARQTYLGHEP